MCLSRNLGAPTYKILAAEAGDRLGIHCHVALRSCVPQPHHHVVEAVQPAKLELTNQPTNADQSNNQSANQPCNSFTNDGKPSSTLLACCCWRWHCGWCAVAVVIDAVVFVAVVIVMFVALFCCCDRWRRRRRRG